ncbi:MAG: hypothetical protein KJO29_13645, partial [Bacteroidia bacterium]|nr:hypothetical protein [Bacteroidia bacterium]
MSLLVFACSKDQNNFAGEINAELTQNIINASPTGAIDYYELPVYNNLVRVPQDRLNPLSQEKVQLGQMLFFETGLGITPSLDNGMNSYSCATCHLPQSGFTPDNVQGIGEGGLGVGINRIKDPVYENEQLDIQSIRPLSLINVGFVENTFWNGQFGSGKVNIGTDHIWPLREDTEFNALGFESIETQNMIGLISHRLSMSGEMADAFGYTELFDNAFPDVIKEERYSPRTTSLAISAFLRTIITTHAPFQKWLKGDDSALTDDQKAGGAIFFGKAKCYKCHYEKNLGSHEFHALGVKDMDQNEACVFAKADDRRNLGRGGFTLEDSDLYKFRVPGLYNTGDYSFYFHGSSKTSLEAVIEYKLAAIAENP